MIAKKLAKGSHIRVVAPARSGSIIAQETRDVAINIFRELGIRVSFSKNMEEIDEFVTSSVASRVADLHEAFLDPSVDAIFTAIGGYSTTELLDYLDFEIIKKNPKIICGYSDITALCNAIYAKTGLVTYSGPHFSSFGMKKGFDYTLENFGKALIDGGRFEVEPSYEWSDDLWFLDQEKREFYKDDGHWVINQGSAKGKIVGGNNHLIGLLRGTKYMPSIKDSILFIEQFGGDAFYTFKQELQALIQMPDFSSVKGIVIGRFQKANNVNRELLEKIVKSLAELNNIPVIANVAFGHATPIITFPIGGVCEIVDGRIFIEE